MTQPDLSWCEKGGSRGYVTTRSFDWDIGKEGSGWVLTVEAGREFESSVPKFLRWAFSPDDPFFLLSAAIHDKLLEEGFRKAFADSQWFEAALSIHAPALRTWGGFTAMRLRRLILWALGQYQLGLPALVGWVYRLFKPPTNQ